ncbi:MAG: M43 family zinc metalloprotease [Bacteroidota bacterium]
MKKKLYKYIFVSTLIFAQAKIVFAQNGKQCGTTEATQVLHTTHPELLEKELNYNKELAQQIQYKKQQKALQATEPIYTIPVVFHVIHTFGPENISDAQIIDQVNILNRDYAKLNTDTSNIVGNTPFDSLAANVKIRFRLARLDPDGNCTNGIERIYSHKTNKADDNSKLNQWPRDKYLNVWTVKTIGEDGVAGYAYFPSDVDGITQYRDGILILSEYIGSIGTGAAFTSRALTHEIGHWMSLYHPWGGTNSPEVACGDDEVIDTPETKGHLSCSLSDLMGAVCDLHTLSPSYNFNSITPASGTTDTAQIQGAIGANFAQFSAVGVSGNSSDSSRFSFSNWDTGATNGDTLVYDSLTGSINTSKYYEVTVNPAWGRSMSLSGIAFTFQRSATGVRTYSVRSSVNGFASNLPASVIGNSNLSIEGTNEFFNKYDTTISHTGSTIALSGASYTNVITPITFRFYGWNAEDSVGTFSIDNVSFNGSAGTIENTQNYMDYSYCEVMFTTGQKERMRTALESNISFRNRLWRTSNLVATGTDDAGQAAVVCIPVPDFFSNRNAICAGANVTFTKNISLGTASNTVWTFDGGTPSTSTAATPVVTYNTPGDYSVKLKGSNSSGSDSVIKDYFIHVSNPGAHQYNGLAFENFETSPNYASWIVNNYDSNNNYWAFTNTAGHSGNHSMVMNGFENYAFDVDDFVTPAFDMSFVSGASLTFRCAAASKALLAADLNEVLKIYSSTNCGQTWQIRSTFQGSALCNNGYHPESFHPDSPSQWALRTIAIPNNIATDNVRFKFEFTTGNASNNIYIDDVNINGVLGVNENDTDAASILIYPNPTDQTATVSYHLNKKGNTKIELLDLLGKKIMEITNNDQPEGDYSIPISKQQYNISNGIYFIKLSIDNTAITKKTIFTE